MGQVINFINNSTLDFSPSLIDCYSVLLSSFNKLKSIGDISVVIVLNEDDVIDEKNLSYIAKQVIAMKNSGINVIIIPPEITKDSFDFVKEIYKINSNMNDLEYIEMALWSKIALKISDKINSNGGVGIRISGIDANLVFGQKTDLPISNLYDFNRFNGLFAKPYRLNTNFFEDIKKSNFIPVITPVCKVDGDKIAVMNSVEFGCFLAKSIDFARVLISTDINSMNIQQKIISTAKIQSMISNNVIIDKCNFFENIIDVLSSTVDYVHIVKLSEGSILNEITFTASNGILVYNDDHDL